MSFKDDLINGKFNKDEKSTEWTEREINIVVNRIEHDICEKAKYSIQKGIRSVEGYLEYYPDDYGSIGSFGVKSLNSTEFGDKYYQGSLKMDFPLEIIKNRVELVLKQLGFTNYLVKIDDVAIYEYKLKGFDFQPKWEWKSKWEFSHWEKTLYIQFNF